MGLVSVSRGWILLEGAVERRFQKMAAEDAVADLAGGCGRHQFNRSAAVPAGAGVEGRDRDRARALRGPECAQDRR